MLAAWKGKAENVPIAQAELLKRAKVNIFPIWFIFYLLKYFLLNLKANGEAAQGIYSGNSATVSGDKQGREIDRWLALNQRQRKFFFADFWL